MLTVKGRCRVDIAGAKEYYKENNPIERKERPFWRALYEGRPDTPTWKYWNQGYDQMLNYGSRILEIAEESQISLKWFDEFLEFVLVGTQGSDDCVVWVPKEFVQQEYYKDYTNLTGAERRDLLAGSSTSSSVFGLISASDTCLAEVQSRSETCKREQNALQQELDDIKNGKAAELEELQKALQEAQAALDKKKEELMVQLAQKKAELSYKMREISVELLKIESEIYAIRCYTGEVVEFQKLRDGTPASPDRPLIVQQRLRYLDEELGKVSSIYGVDYEDTVTLHKLIQNRDDVVETLLPYERCMTLIQVSKDKVRFADIGGNFLEPYSLLHGYAVGIFIRDGERIYAAWTDDTTVRFEGEAFYRPGSTIQEPGDRSELDQRWGESEEKYEERMFNLKMKEAKAAVSRYFVFSILQGLLDRKVIQFAADHVDVGNSDLVIFSYADATLMSYEFDDLETMIDRANKSVVLGDTLLTVQRLYPSSFTHRYETWNNDRGVGEKNRTHDVVAPDNSIHKVNYIVHRAKYRVVTTYRDNHEVKESDDYLTDEEVKEFRSRDWSGYYWKKTVGDKLEGTDEYDIFISLEKSENWQTGKTPRANFQLYPDEYINLTYMNSNWLEYTIATSRTGNMRIGGSKVDFIYLLRYLKTAMDFVKKREENEVLPYLRKLDPSVAADPKWPSKMTEWMLEKNIHNFSEFRCKQFVKYLHEQGGSLQ